MMPEEEEDVERPVRHGMDHEQIRGPDPPELIPEERAPALVITFRSGATPAVPSDRSVAHDDPKLHQFATDAPERILLGDPGYQRSDFRIQGRPT